VDQDTLIRAVWDANAAAWTTAVRGGSIRSRRVATDAAIVDAVLARRPQRVLDIGCGEGWMARALSMHGVDVLGLDGAPALVEQARNAGGGTFRVMTQEALGEGALMERFDVVVCNFALFGKDVVERLLARMPQWLAPSGVFVMQTLHPASVPGHAGDRDGWRSGSWNGCGAGFEAAPPWYFRTLDSWLALLRASRLCLLERHEPRDPDDGKPLSLLLMAGADGSALS
jgi:2-polyprenyl-3-methyl-5-hydroxy-6-metoxy-1,4-benzoquinol methylase